MGARYGKRRFDFKLNSLVSTKEYKVGDYTSSSGKDAYKIVDDSIVFMDDRQSTVKGLPWLNKDVHANAVDNREQLKIEGIDVRFPFKPYPCQIQLMSKVIRCLKGLVVKKEHAILESPTGTGKTMSLLCSSIAWLEALKSSVALKSNSNYTAPDELTIHTDKVEEPSPTDKPVVGEGSIPKIYFASRTHKQLSQVVRELRRSGYTPNFVVLASRSQYCINDRVRRAKDINEACFEAITLDVNHCSFINKVEKFLQKDPTSALSLGVEELVEFGSQKSLCPYFMARELSEVHAEVVFCPFDYIVNPSIREAVGVNLEGAVVIFDEAHNIEDVCRDAGGIEATGGQLLAIKTEIEQYIDPISGAPSDQLLLPAEHMSQLAVCSSSSFC